jgi:hypothetical protein
VARKELPWGGWRPWSDRGTCRQTWRKGRGSTAMKRARGHRDVSGARVDVEKRNEVVANVPRVVDDGGVQNVDRGEGRGGEPDLVQAAGSAV